MVPFSIVRCYTWRMLFIDMGGSITKESHVLGTGTLVEIDSLGGTVIKGAIMSDTIYLAHALLSFITAPVLSGVVRLA
mgnify:CR=1 FL=1